jgi:hypothetical protein
MKSGIPEEHISSYDSPVEAARFALENAREGDLLVFLALTQRQEVLDLVHQFLTS